MGNQQMYIWNAFLQGLTTDDIYSATKAICKDRGALGGTKPLSILPVQQISIKSSNFDLVIGTIGFIDTDYNL